jgi:hypothetical protein
MFDGVFIHDPLASFPLPLFEDSYTNDTRPIILNLSLLQSDVPYMETSTLLLDWMDTPYGGHMTAFFPLGLPCSKMQNHY